MANIDINDVIKTKQIHKEELENMATSIIAMNNSLKRYGIISKEDDEALQRILDKIGAVCNYVNIEEKSYMDLELSKVTMEDELKDIIGKHMK